MRLKSLIFAAALMAAGVAQASQLPYPTVSGLIDSQLPTNGSGSIQAAPLRAVLHDITDSVPIIGAVYPAAISASTYTYLVTDQASNYSFTAATVAITLQQPGTPASPNTISRGWWAILTASSSSTPTVTPTGATINGTASLTISPSQSYLISTDGTNYFAVPLGNSGGGGGIGSFPVAVSGAVNSGGVAYFNSAIQMSSSAALVSNALVVGGGAGNAPSTITTGPGVITALGQTASGSGAIILASSPTIAAPTLTSPIVTSAFTATGLVTNSDLASPTVTVNTVACTLGASCTISAASSLIVGSSTITSGTSGDIEFNNAGVLGEKGVTGSGNVVEATGATLVTPNLGTPSTIVLTNGSGLPISAINSLGTGVPTALAINANAANGFTVQGVGGRLYPVTSISTAYGVLSTDYYVVATGASGVPTFPTAAGITGQAYIFKNNSGSSITPATTSSQTIDGASPAALSNHGVLKIFSDGTGNWSTW